LDAKDVKDMNVGIIMAILAAIGWSFAIYTLKLLLDHSQVDVFAMATVRFAFLTIFTTFILIGMTIYQVFTESQNTKFKKVKTQKLIRKGNFFILGIAGVLSWGIGGIFFFTSIDMIGAGRASPISSINPFIAVILSVIFLKEHLTKLQIFGIFLATLGSIIVA